jgi:5'(3')-deoxyribonucleotidase
VTDRKKINMDVDGVVCGFVVGLFERLRTAGFDPEPYHHAKWRTWDIFKVMPEDMRTAAFAIMRSPSFWTQLPTVDYAQDAIAAFRSEGYKIRWVTTPWDKCFGWRDARRDWLDEKFGCADQDLHLDLICAGDKSDVWADVFVDDKPSHIIAWHKNHPAPRHRGILYRTNFNSHHHDDLENIIWSPESVEMILRWLAGKEK